MFTNFWPVFAGSVLNGDPFPHKIDVNEFENESSKQKSHFKYADNFSQFILLRNKGNDSPV